MSSDKTSLGDRMKDYERRYNHIFMPYIPIVARMDGRSFHTFTHGLNRPYDQGLSDLMIETTRYLVTETNARCGYTQSDEISLVWLVEIPGSEIMFAGKLQKMNSILASMTTAFFNRNLPKYLPSKVDAMPLFDARVFQVPTAGEAANHFVWREQDATRNSVQMAARSEFSHHECNNKSCPELQEMLFTQRGINWNDYPEFFKRGTYVRRRTINRTLTPEELLDLPERHHARQNPEMVVSRSSVVNEHFAVITKMINREAVLLHGAEPMWGIVDVE